MTDFEQRLAGIEAEKCPTVRGAKLLQLWFSLLDMIDSERPYISDATSRNKQMFHAAEARLRAAAGTAAGTYTLDMVMRYAQLATAERHD